VPSATILPGDMTALDLPPASFDGVAAFYSITHVPRDEHPGLLRSIATWLRPGGYLVASMGSRSTPGWREADWLGAPTYFSSFDAATNRRLVEEAGLRIVRAELETAEEFGRPTTFLWVVAQRPRPPASAD